jgi:hypothetical protein
MKECSKKEDRRSFATKMLESSHKKLFLIWEEACRLFDEEMKEKINNIIREEKIKCLKI